MNDENDARAAAERWGGRGNANEGWFVAGFLRARAELAPELPGEPWADMAYEAGFATGEA